MLQDSITKLEKLIQSMELDITSLKQQISEEEELYPTKRQQLTDSILLVTNSSTTDDNKYLLQYIPEIDIDSKFDNLFTHRTHDQK